MPERAAQTFGPPRRKLLLAAAPAVSVLLWSTGFNGAKLCLPYAEPFTFPALRYALVGAAARLAGMVVAVAAVALVNFSERENTFVRR